MSNQIQLYLRSDSVQQRISELLDKKAPQFTTSLMSVLNSNIVLQECKPQSVLTAAITAASLDLPINPNLGFAYIIPYRNKKKIKDETGKEHFEYVWEAQFQIGYKGFIQLAQRSGYYKTINATDVREGEFLGENHLSGELDFKWEEDDKARRKLKVIGHVAYFRLHNGFEKSLYMTSDELRGHAKKYSQSYKKGYGLWVDEFDTMAAKTVLKLLISKYGPMSTAMQEAILADQAAVEEDSFKYVDNQEETVAEAAVDNNEKSNNVQGADVEDGKQE